MKKKLVLFAIMFIVTFVGVGMTFAFENGVKEKKEEILTVVTSFYPMYIAAANVMEEAMNVELINLTGNQEGCLHDYQLTTTDMKKLENADVFIINGGGMEAFLEKIVKMYKDITVIDASKGIPLLRAAEHHHEGEKEGEEHTKEMNAHVWMNPKNYRAQIENIAEGLSKADSANKVFYEKNGAVYCEKVKEIEEQLQTIDVKKLQTGIISFHDAFSYLADALLIPVIHSVDVDKDTSLGAGEVAEIIDEVRENNVKFLFTEKQLSESSPKRVAEETKVKLCVMDSLVSGEMGKDAYLEGMKRNIEVLKQVLVDE